MFKFFGIGLRNWPAELACRSGFQPRRDLSAREKSRLEAAPTADREQLLLQPFWAKPCNSKKLNIEF
jgi:hypothetical protein